MRAEDRHRLARLDEQRFLLGEILERGYRDGFTDQIFGRFHRGLLPAYPGAGTQIAGRLRAVYEQRLWPG